MMEFSTKDFLWTRKQVDVRGTRCRLGTTDASELHGQYGCAPLSMTCFTLRSHVTNAVVEFRHHFNAVTEGDLAFRDYIAVNGPSAPTLIVRIYND